MTRSPIPTICLVALACMIAAGASHWWSVNQLVSVFDASQPAPRGHAMHISAPAQPAIVAPQASAAAVSDLAATPQLSALAESPYGGGEPAAMQQFYQELIREMQQLRNQNRDLLNQVAETNRDIMKLEFRVDTHSEQFRPLPVAKDTFGTTYGTSLDDSPGLLPLRTEPEVPPFTE